MYVPPHYVADDAEALIARLAPARAALLVTIDDAGAPFATHAPILWDAERRIASGHIARANSQWKHGAGKALIVLSGAEAYVSPSFYPSKAEHGKTVPTWNYETVHLTGDIAWFDDAPRLEQIVRDLSARHEAGRAHPWTIEDAPRAYIDAMLRGFIGFELSASRVEAKRKLSQNKSAMDFDGVVAGLSAGQHEEGEVANLMRAVRAVSDDPDGN
jgi:transcriptional regulator